MTLLLALPLGLLCLYLAWLSYGKNHRTALVLLAIGGVTLTSGLLLTVLFWLFWPAPPPAP